MTKARRSPICTSITSAFATSRAGLIKKLSAATKATLKENKNPLLLCGKLYINGKCSGCLIGFGGTLRNDSKKQVPLDGGHLNIVSRYLHRLGSSIDENSIGFFISKAPYKNHLQKLEEGPSEVQGISEN